MRLILIFFVGYLIFLSNSISAQSANYLHIADFLLPETQTWIKVDNDGKNRIHDISPIATDLREAYLNSRLAAKNETKNCQLIDRILKNDSSESYFFSVDANADGLDDVLYTGSAQCKEGDITIVWFKDQKGYEVTQYSAGDGLALRFKPGNKTLFSSVQVGCCSELTDSYSIGILDNFRTEKIVSISKDTVLPNLDNEPINSLFQGNTEFSIRSSPDDLNKYDYDRSDFMGNATYGNILAKYLPGCGGRVIARIGNSENDSMKFVLLNTTCYAYRTHSPFNINAGWVKSSEIRISVPSDNANKHN